MDSVFDPTAYPRLSSANTFTAAQTIDLGTGASPGTAPVSPNLVIRSANGATTREYSEVFGANGRNAICRMAAGTRAVPLYPTTGTFHFQFSSNPWSEALNDWASQTARFTIETTENHGASARGTGFGFVGTLNGATTTTVFATLYNGMLGVGTAAPTSGNGLLQLTSGTTKANGIAFGTDTFLYRSAAGVIKTDGALTIASATNSTSYTTGSLVTAGGLGVTGDVFTNGNLTISSSILIKTNSSLSNGAAGNTATLTNAPAAGNPTKWVAINDNGTTRYIPAW